MRFEIDGATHPGIVRADEPNEDSFAVRRDMWESGDALVVLADGMGGPPHGELASRAAVEAIERAELATGPEQFLLEAFQLANTAVRALEVTHLFGRPGTTLLALYLRAAQGWIANVGDCRVYRFRRGELQQLTHDHSAAQEEIDRGQLTPEEAYRDPRVHLLTRTIGGEATVLPDLFRVRPEVGDRYLVCSDGLWGVLKDEMIAGALDPRRTRTRGIADSLVRTALDAGGPDNVTAVVVDALEDVQ